MKTTLSHDFKTIVIFKNPASTHAKAVKGRIERLQKKFPHTPIWIYTTSARGVHANQKLLIKHKDKLGSRTLLCIAAGDGTANTFIEALLYLPELRSVRKTPVLPLWGGNANDLAVMLNGLASKTTVEKVVSSGRVMPIYPLECHITTFGKTVVHFASNYISFGASARAAHMLNDKQHRTSRLLKYPGGRFLRELLTTLKAFLESPVFFVREGGQRRPVFERVFANGSRIARINSLPVRLTDGEFYQVRVETDHPLLFFRRLLDLFYRRKPHIRQKKPAQFTTEAPTFAQFDGEATEIPQDAQVTIRLAKRPFYALTTKLQ